MYLTGHRWVAFIGAYSVAACCYLPTNHFYGMVAYVIPGVRKMIILVEVGNHLSASMILRDMRVLV